MQEIAKLEALLATFENPEAGGINEVGVTVSNPSITCSALHFVQNTATSVCAAGWMDPTPCCCESWLAAADSNTTLAQRCRQLHQQRESTRCAHHHPAAHSTLCVAQRSRTPLHEAVAHQHIGVVRILLESQADVEAVDSVRALLACCCQPSDCYPQAGDNPLKMAVERMDERLIMMLLTAGARPDATPVRPAVCK